MLRSDVTAVSSLSRSSSRSSGWVVLALTAASIEPILIKLGFQAQATPVQLLVLKNLVAALVMLLLVRGWKRPANVSFASLLLVSLLLFATNALCIFALTKLTAVELITIITSTPVVVALVNCFRRHDSRGKLFWFGLGAALAGVFLSLQVPVASKALNIVGVVFALAAVLSSTTYRIKIEVYIEKGRPTAGFAQYLCH
jgi:hypothetical protein